MWAKSADNAVWHAIRVMHNDKAVGQCGTSFKIQEGPYTSWSSGGSICKVCLKKS